MSVSSFWAQNLSIKVIMGTTDRRSAHYKLQREVLNEDSLILFKKRGSWTYTTAYPHNVYVVALLLGIPISWHPFTPGSPAWPTELQASSPAAGKWKRKAQTVRPFPHQQRLLTSGVLQEPGAPHGWYNGVMLCWHGGSASAAEESLHSAAVQHPLRAICQQRYRNFITPLQGTLTEILQEKVTLSHICLG